jgi:hypothetical protein
MAVQGPPTALSVNLTDASGAVTRLGSEDTSPEDIPTGISFRTARDGFSDASMTLNRRIDRDYIDVNLLDEVELVGADGTIAYEGRIGASPRSFDGSHSVSLQFAGWISHARDRQFTEIYVDRDLSQWHGSSTGRDAGLLAASFTRASPPTVATDTATQLPGLIIQHAEAWASPMQPIAEAWYDAGTNNMIGAVYWDMINSGNASTASGTWDLFIRTTSTDAFGSVNASSGDQWGPPGAGYLIDPAPVRYAVITFSYGATPGGAAGYVYSVVARKLTVYGSHGLTRYGSDPGGLRASDVIRNVAARFCPKLNTGGVLDTSFPIPHLVFRDLTHPYDAFLEVNKYHLWDFGVWENKTLFYKPVDLTDYDWEIRLDDHDYPASVSLQGDSTQDLANGVTVQYQDVLTGQQTVLMPTSFSELRDDDVENPFTKHGYQAWKPYQVSVPTTQAAALQLGRAALAEFNQPQAPGSITIGPHVRDRAGHPQQAWKVRAGDRVVITSSISLSDRPRMISETSYDHSSRQVTMSLDGGIKRLDAVVDRLSVALTAANMGG